MPGKKLITTVLAVLAAVALLCACGDGGSIFNPGPKPVEFQAGKVSPEGLTELSIQLQSGETALLDQLPDLQKADFSGSDCVGEIYEWAQAHPDVKVIYTVTLPDGTVVSSLDKSVDLTGLRSGDTDVVSDCLALLPKLKTVELGRERSGFGWDDVGKIAAACPQAQVKYSFTLYGKEYSTEDTTINLSHIPVDDGGAAVKQAMAYMPNLSNLDMDSCGVSDEDMAAIRDAYPDVKVVWRIWFGDAYSVRTDVEKILASQPLHGGMLTRDNTQSLKYCTDVKYLDVGHNDALDDISFVAYMPKLEVAILAMDNWSDATPLASCHNLEYLEMQTTLCTDLSPLSGLTNLRHLNVAYNLDLSDISPLYSLTGLERLWLGCYNRVPQEQVEEMQKAAPDCEINTTVYDDPTGGRWRYVDYNDLAYVFILHPRYELLREQFGYESGDFSFYWNDPLY